MKSTVHQSLHHAGSDGHTTLLQTSVLFAHFPLLLECCTTLAIIDFMSLSIAHMPHLVWTASHDRHVVCQSTCNPQFFFTKRLSPAAKTRSALSTVAHRANGALVCGTVSSQPLLVQLSRHKRPDPLQFVKKLEDLPGQANEWRC